jgi:hypothetical protein
MLFFKGMEKDIKAALDISQFAAAQYLNRRSPPPKRLPSPTAGPRLCSTSEKLLPSPVNCDNARAAPLVIPPFPVRRFNSMGVHLIRKSRVYIWWYQEGFFRFAENARLRREMKRLLAKKLGSDNGEKIEMSRSELQLMVRTRKDLRKVPGMTQLALLIQSSQCWSGDQIYFSSFCTILDSIFCQGRVLLLATSITVVENAQTI